MLIDPQFLARASADLKRVDAEAAKYEADPEGYIERNFTALSQWDFPVYCAANVRITTKDGRTVPFRFNRVQRKLWEWFLEDIASGRPVRVFYLKARQMGVSTFVLCLLHWLTSLRPSRNALVLTQDTPSVENFNSRVRAILSEGHPLLTPPTITNKRDLIHFASPTAERKKGAGAGLDSRMIFMPAKRPGLGRSYTFQYALLSEICFWPTMKPAIDVDDKLGALRQALPEAAGTAIFMESTPNGKNRTEEIWNDAVKGVNGIRAVFLPWVALDSYRLPLREGETLDLCGAEEIGGQQTRYGNEVEEARLVRGQLKEWYPEEFARGGDAWLDREVQARLNWRRYYIDTACQGDKKQFRKEYPTTPAHGFEATSKNCFDLASLNALRNHVAEEGIQPKRFRYIHDPENENVNEKFAADPYGELVVYDLPTPGQQFVLAADPGMGIENSGDPSAAVVLAVPDLKEVASFNAICSPDVFAEMCYYLGRLYNDALLGVENNERGGYAANLRLHRDLKYPRLFYRFDFYDKKAAGQPGFVTKATNKGILVSDLAQLIREHEILVRTPEAIEQLAHYVALDNGELCGAPGFHDDLVSALMIAVHLSTKIHQFPPRIEAPAKGTAGHAFKRHAERNRPGLFGFK
jgi:hypothetical protein